MRIVVVGMGYVGMASAVLLAQRHDVCAVDIDQSRVRAIRDRRSPIADPDIEDFLTTKNLRLSATADILEALPGADFVVIATPTDYDPDTQFFNTSTVESVLATVAQHAPGAAAVIKSTIPVGFTERVRKDHPGLTILFSPEFLQEGQALHDNLHPSRIVVADPCEGSVAFTDRLREACQNADTPVLFTGTTVAEELKLFIHTYLAKCMVGSNKLHTCAATRGLDARSIDASVSRDARIGASHENPSIGHAGNCLPNDSKQLRVNHRAIIRSSAARKTSIFSVKPGLTDPASIEFRNEQEVLAQSSDPETYYVQEVLPRKVAIYREYVKLRSLLGDLLIIARTVVSVVRA